jgi:DNA helicase HerA-like ATPase
MDRSILNSAKPSVIRLHLNTSEVLQRAFAAFVLHNLYQEMFIRGLQKRLTHAIIFDEAHKASGLKLIPTMGKECRKYGISMIVASQEARDFNGSLFAAISNYLILRLTENDAKTISRNVAPTESAVRIADRMKQLEKYTGLFFCEGSRRATFIQLRKP